MSSKNAHYGGNAIPERETVSTLIFPLSIRHPLHNKSIFAAGSEGSFFTSTDERLAREESEDADRIFGMVMTDDSKLSIRYADRIYISCTYCTFHHGTPERWNRKFLIHSDPHLRYLAFDQVVLLFSLYLAVICKSPFSCHARPSFLIMGCS